MVGAVVVVVVCLCVGRAYDEGYAILLSNTHTHRHARSAARPFLPPTQQLHTKHTHSTLQPRRTVDAPGLVEHRLDGRADAPSVRHVELEQPAAALGEARHRGGAPRGRVDARAARPERRELRAEVPADAAGGAAGHQEDVDARRRVVGGARHLGCWLLSNLSNSLPGAGAAGGAPRYNLVPLLRERAALQRCSKQQRRPAVVRND